jgi:hypothetical protein
LPLAPRVRAPALARPPVGTGAALHIHPLELRATVGDTPIETAAAVAPEATLDQVADRR